MLSKFLAILSLGLSAAPASAMPAEYQVNVREGCRQAVAGGYLKAYDERERLRAYALALKEQAQALQIALKDAQATAKTAAKAAQEQTFDAGRAAATNASRGVVRSLQAQLADYQTLLGEQAERLAAAQAEELRLRSLISQVFHVERTGDLQDGGYPVKTTYKVSCPKYRALCPLPEADRKSLAKITIDGALPQACQRYVSQSNL